MKSRRHIERQPYLGMWRELAAGKSMVFLAGPRQAGKTTLAKDIAASFADAVYFNWDVPSNKALLRRNPAFFTQQEITGTGRPLVVLDEIHKSRSWKNYLKGIYDQYHEQYQFLVSGSGRLDIYQRGQDSLAGRYFMFHLWPFTLAELGRRQRSLDAFLADPQEVLQPHAEELRRIWERLLRFSGFPEPYLAADDATWQRWSDTYGRQLIREDIRDLVVLNSLQNLETLYALLPHRIGSLLSLNALAGELQVSYNSVKSWVEVLERFFMAFRLSPWTRRLSRAVQKEKKLYLFNPPLIPDLAARFENAAALELHRAVSNWNDLGLGRFSLHFLRNKDKQEVDFLIASGQKPLVLIETKLSDYQPSPALLKFQNELGVPAVQLVNEGDDTFRLIPNGPRKVLVIPAWRWLAGLP